MGFWDRALRGLRSAGVEVTAWEEAVLEKGGTVCYLMPLGAFTRHSYGRSLDTMNYPDGRQVRMPLRVDCVSPNLPVLNTGREHSDRYKRPLWEEMDQEYMRSWRLWPAYLGIADYDSMEMVSTPWCMEWHWTENYRPYRVWSCAALEADTIDLELRCEAAANAMLDRSWYRQVDEIACRESDGDIWAEDACIALGLAADPRMSAAEQAKDRDRAYGAAMDAFNGEDDLAEYAAMYMDLVKANVLGFSWSTRAQIDALDEITLVPFEDTLREQGDIEAARWWHTQVRRAGANRNQIRNSYYQDAGDYARFAYEEVMFA